MASKLQRANICSDKGLAPISGQDIARTMADDDHRYIVMSSGCNVIGRRADSGAQLNPLESIQVKTVAETRNHCWRW